MNLNGSQTQKNLMKTFSGESMARNRYNLYAEQARREDLQFVASIFDQTALNEYAHARRVYANFLKEVKSTAENLMSAITGEALEAQKLYREYEKTARQEGFLEIADFYKELSEVEAEHRDRFSRVLQNLKAGKMFHRDVVVKWQCMNCGYIHEGKEAPKVCPLCKFPQGYFQIYCENYK